MKGVSAVEDWLSQWRQKPEDLDGYGQQLLLDEAVFAAVLAIFEHDHCHQLLEQTCSQLLEYYQSGRKQLCCFCWQLVPSLIAAHLNSVATNTRQAMFPVETLLLSLYNVEVVERAASGGQAKVVSFRMPTLIRQSVYHEPLRMTPSSLTEHSISRVRLGDNFTVDWGPFPQMKRLDSRSRQTVLSTLLSVYSGYLSYFSTSAVLAACRAISRVCEQGFPTADGGKSNVRLVVSSMLLLEFVHVVQFFATPSLHLSCDESDLSYSVQRSAVVQAAAQQAVAALLHRAAYQTYPDVLAALFALTHKLQLNKTAEQASPSPTKADASPPSRSACIITNASFRTRKLPEDIPIRRTPLSDGVGQLGSIDEQGGATPSGAVAVSSGAAGGASPADSQQKSRQRVPRGAATGPDRHVTAVLAALPALKRRSAGERRRPQSGEQVELASGPVEADDSTRSTDV